MMAYGHHLQGIPWEELLSFYAVEYYVSRSEVPHWPSGQTAYNDNHPPKLVSRLSLLSFSDMIILDASEQFSHT